MNSNASSSSVMLMWADYGEIASLIDNLPRWSQESPTTPEEWRQYVRLALALRDMEPEDVERVLIVFMNRHPLAPRTSPAAVWAWTKPFLLLRVMFDLPQTPVSDADRGTWMRDNHIAVLPGPIAYKSIEGQSWQPPFSLSLPVAWVADGPSLTCHPIERMVPGTGNIRDTYQPHLEYRYFRANYQYRDSLEAFLGEPAPSWNRLVLERHVPAEVLEEIDDDSR